MSLAAGTTQRVRREGPVDGPSAAQRQQTRVFVADFREVSCLFRPCSHPGRSHPGPGRVRGQVEGGAPARGYPARRCPTRTQCACARSPTRRRRTTTSCYRVLNRPRTRPVPPGPRHEAGRAGHARRAGPATRAGPGRRTGPGTASRSRASRAGARRPGGTSPASRTSGADRTSTGTGISPADRQPQPMVRGLGSSRRCWWKRWPGRGRRGRSRAGPPTGPGPGSSAWARCSRPASGLSCAGWWPSGQRPTSLR